MTCEQYWEIATNTLYALWVCALIFGAFCIGYGIGGRKK